MLCKYVQVRVGPAADQSVEVAELTRQIGSIDADITLVNERLDKSQGMCSSFLIYIGKYESGIILMQYAWTADGAAVVEALRAELAQAKKQARVSNAVALKAAEELRAEQAAHYRSEEKIAEMAGELKNVTDRYALLEKENKASSIELDKALNAAKEMQTEIRSMR